MSFKLVFPVLVFQFNIGIVPEEIFWKIVLNIHVFDRWILFFEKNVKI